MNDDSAGAGSTGRPGTARRLFFDDLAEDPDAPPVGRAGPTAPAPSIPASVPTSRPTSRPTSGPPRPVGSPRRLLFDDLAHEGESEVGGADDDETVGGGRPVRPIPPAAHDSRRRLVPTAVGVIAVVVIAVVAVALVGRNAPSHPTTAAGHPASKAAPRTTTGRHAAPAKHPQRNAGAPAPTKAAAPAPARVPLTVLNNTTVTGLAHTAAQDFKAHGWSVDQVANYTGRLAATTVFYRGGDAAAQRAARALARQFPEIAQIAPSSIAVPAGNGLTVVLAPDWTTS